MYQMDDVFFILNLENKKIEIYQHFSLILCYFWRQNSLKTWILAFWTTLVNACWPHVCDMTKYILGACKYLSQVPSPQISCPEMQNSSWGVEKTIFFPTPCWWNNHLHLLYISWFCKKRKKLFCNGISYHLWHIFGA